MFSDILLAADFDRTLTDPHTKIPQRNIDAIRYFMDNGGTFTINTGRNPATLHRHMDELMYNAPLLLYNGSASYWNGKLQDLRTIDLPVWPMLENIHALFPDLHIEFQAEEVNYLVDAKADMAALEDGMHWPWENAQWGQDMGPFLKFALWGQARKPKISDMYEVSEAEMAYFDAAQTKLEELWGDKIVCFRPAPRIIDIHAKGVSKAMAVKNLQAQLGKKILVCVGDGENDVPALSVADFAYSPADGVVADRYENVCNCSEGAVADVIYKKIPEILKNRP